MTDYATIEAVKRWASDQPDYFTDATGDPLDDVLERAVAAASRSVEADTGRVFYLVEGEARTCRVDDDGAVHLVDLIADSIESVLYDADYDDVAEAELAATDYVL